MNKFSRAGTIIQPQGETSKVVFKREPSENLGLYPQL